MTRRSYVNYPRRRHKITIRRLVEVDDGKGAYTSEWATIANPWAEAEGLSGREATLDKVHQGIAVYRFRIRWRGDILTADQVKFGSINLNITSAQDPDGLRRDLVIIADTAGARSDVV
ncbi:head-tail adaptor protein [Sphingomonadales bacterium 56]|uniref:phage head closure protein n=1 Tax=Sphingobium sp. S6 TaxID=2758386 RepID=UPI00191A1163|nr:phage head closure protein [Sphingobium sp. S6]MBY2927848.1 head-tail adaptor protein [Sphingomonadales bacterium 56]CAD7336060.1 hypothetical protein SPHS6_00821 [Sphingobium sp. S6]